MWVFCPTDRSGEYAALAIDNTDEEKLSDPNMLITYALQFYERAERARTQEPEKAGEFYAKARNFFERGLYSGTHDADRRNRIKDFIARCLIGAGRIDEAIEEYERMTADDPDKVRLWAWETLADAYRARQTRESQTKATKIYVELYQRLRTSGRLDEHFWRLRYKFMDTMLEYDSDGLHVYLDDLMRRSPYIDDGEYYFDEAKTVKIQDKFFDLIRRARPKMKELPPDPPAKQPEPKPEEP